MQAVATVWTQRPNPSGLGGVLALCGLHCKTWICSGVLFGLHYWRITLFPFYFNLFYMEDFPVCFALFQLTASYNTLIVFWGLGVRGQKGLRWDLHQLCTIASAQWRHWSEDCHVAWFCAGLPVLSNLAVTCGVFCCCMPVLCQRDAARDS